MQPPEGLGDSSGHRGAFGHFATKGVGYNSGKRAALGHSAVSGVREYQWEVGSTWSTDATRGQIRQWEGKHWGTPPPEGTGDSSSGQRAALVYTTNGKQH